MPARHDQVTDPALAARLLTARRGTAYFSRALAELGDEEFSRPSLLPGWSRRHVIAHVGYNARALTRLLEWAATGVETPMYVDADQRRDEIELGSTLKPIALRHLVSHSNVHLDVEWRDLPADRWAATVRTAQGRSVPASETVWMRTREVWVHAVDLDNGASFNDIPARVLDGLLADITGHWRKKGQATGLVLAPTDRDDTITVTADLDGQSDTVTLTGSSADLTRWATGRGSARITVSSGSIPEAPRWL